MNRVCIIPARGGSVRIPRKNIKEFKSVPMLRFPIEVAQQSGLFDLVIVSTDDDEIASLAYDCDASVWRRPTSDADKGTQQIAADVLLDLPRVIAACVVYPCSPMLRAADLREAAKWATLSGQLAVSHLPTGDAGCYYFGDRRMFGGIVTSVLKVPVDPRRFIDINTMEDWQRAESMYEALKEAPR